MPVSSLSHPYFIHTYLMPISSDPQVGALHSGNHAMGVNVVRPLSHDSSVLLLGCENTSTLDVMENTLTRWYFVSPFSLSRFLFVFVLAVCSPPRHLCFVSLIFPRCLFVRSFVAQDHLSEARAFHGLFDSLRAAAAATA